MLTSSGSATRVHDDATAEDNLETFVAVKKKHDICPWHTSPSELHLQKLVLSCHVAVEPT